MEIRVNSLIQTLNASRLPAINPSLTTLENLVRQDGRGRIKFLDRAKQAEVAGAATLHLDVFDPRYVDTGGKPGNMDVFNWQLVRDLKKVVNIPVDVHLMVSPQSRGGFVGFADYMKSFGGEGADAISFHWGAMKKAGVKEAAVKESIIDEVRDSYRDLAIGMVFNPDERLGAAEQRLPKYFIDALDFLMAMTVIPGAGGRGFDDRGVDNIFDAGRSKLSAGSLIAVDGAITPETIGKVVRAGGKWLVVGSYWFGKEGAYKDFSGMQNAYDSLVNALSLSSLYGRAAFSTT